jgi:hypothetical protein
VGRKCGVDVDVAQDQGYGGFRDVIVDADLGGAHLPADDGVVIDPMNVDGCFAGVDVEAHGPVERGMCGGCGADAP